jgi:hypothetical protein
MGMFNYPPPSGDLKIISVFPNQPRDDIFQVSSLCTTYFNDLCTLPSPSALMEVTGNPGMSIPLSVTKFAYSIIQQASIDPDPTPAPELDPVIKPIWAQDSLATTDSLDIVLPSDEAIIEALAGPDKPWDNLHHRYNFLPELRRIEAGEFVLTVTGDRSCPINPLATHAVYVEGNIETIVETIPIDISRTPGIVKNVFIRVDCSPKEIQIYTDLFK